MTKKKDLKPVIRKFKSLLYPFTLYFVLHSDEKTRKKFGYTGNFEHGDAVACTNGRDAAIIIADDLLNDSAEKLISVIAHECFHITTGMMSGIGEELSVEHQEPWAYLIGWAVECVIKVVKEDKKWKI